MVESPSSAAPSSLKSRRQFQSRARLVVIGGGISGTSAAWTAAREAVKQGLDVETLLLEKETVLGGKASAIREDGWLFETGPLGYLDNDPIVDELVRGVGLEEERVPASDASSHRFVFLDGRLKEVASHPVRFLASGLLSPRALLRAACEPFVRAKRDGLDESVWDFAARRLGRDVADRLIHPMVLGIFAGDAKRLSLPSAFPIMAELERDHGSLIRAQLARSRARRRGTLPPRRSSLFSFRDGLETLPRRLSERGSFETRTACVVLTVTRREEGFLVVLEGGASIPADSVIVASEGFSAASLLADAAPDVSQALAEISYPPVYVIALGYGAEAKRSIPRGFGALIPRGAGFRSLGVTWDGHLFPGHNAEDGLLVRVLLGGTFDPEIAKLDENAAAAIAEGEMQRLFALSVAPRFLRARLWRQAIPQYELGHGARVQLVDEALARTPGLFLAGNALHGTAFGKAAARGVACGERAIVWLAGRAPKK